MPIAIPLLALLVGLVLFVIGGAARSPHSIVGASVCRYLGALLLTCSGVVLLVILLTWIAAPL